MWSSSANFRDGFICLYRGDGLLWDSEILGFWDKLLYARLVHFRFAFDHARSVRRISSENLPGQKSTKQGPERIEARQFLRHQSSALFLHQLSAAVCGDCISVLLSFFEHPRSSKLVHDTIQCPAQLYADGNIHYFTRADPKLRSLVSRRPALALAHIQSRRFNWSALLLDNSVPFGFRCDCCAYDNLSYLHYAISCC